MHRVGELTPNWFSGCSVHCPPELIFPPHFLKIVVEVKASGPPHVLKLWLVISKGMLPITYFHSNKASFCIIQISWSSYDCQKVEVNLATHSLGDITGFKTVASVCLSYAQLLNTT